MKNNPFPQAQMLDSRGVLHEGHGAVNNPVRIAFNLDNLLKSITIRHAAHSGHGARTQAPPGFCADLAQPPLPTPPEAWRGCHNPWSL
jgi:hypothetical protein